MIPFLFFSLAVAMAVPGEAVSASSHTEFNKLTPEVAMQAAVSSTREVELSAKSLQRRDLPDDFPDRVLEVGFAVIEVEVRNVSNGERQLKLEDIQVISRKNKTLKRALPTEIAPKIFKFYQGSTARVHGETYAGLPPYASPRVRNRNSTTIGVTPSRPTVSAGLGPQLRAVLEHYELKTAPLPAGKSLLGYIYVKSKKTGKKLSGGRVKLGADEASF